MQRPRVYISGPITLGDREKNFGQASDVHRALIENGFAPWNPILSMCVEWDQAVAHQVWVDVDLPWVAQADAVFRLPGESTGAEAECDHARHLGIPVYCDLADLIKDRDHLGLPLPVPMTDDEIKAERQKVYGDPLENHKGIAQMWAPVLQPHADSIANGWPVPPHVVALLMALLKVDRMRLRYHEDNYADARNYLAFAQEWQEMEHR